MQTLTAEESKIIIISAFAILLTSILLVYLPVSAAYSEIQLISSKNTKNIHDRHSTILTDNNSSLGSGSQSGIVNKLTPTPSSSTTEAEQASTASAPPIKMVALTTTNANLTGTNKHDGGVDKFGIKEIHPTKKDGREWYINMNNPVNDTLFSIGGSSQSITQQTNDGSWRIANPQVRMRVTAPPDSAQWKNVEITGYVKVNSTSDNRKHQGDIPNDIAWLARSGRHNDEVPCDGTALIGGIRDDGSVGWKKEIWFTGGYTKELAQAKPTDSIVGRWIGWKVIMYNMANDTAVRMESYLDDNSNNHWVKVTDIIDDGGWYADAGDDEFYSADCGKPKDYIITDSGPVVIFRADNMILDFKNLSVREIESS
jgi:hypothetical protein